jgi:hypothetical protein
MKKHFVNNFYLKVGLWSFFCLGLGGICNFVKAEIIHLERSGNEAAAAQTIQSMRSLQTRYAQKHQGRFAKNFDELIKTGALDEKFAGGKPVVNGYVFEMIFVEPTGLNPAFYSINADPQDSESFFKKGIRHFYFDSRLGTVKITDENRRANANDASF